MTLQIVPAEQRDEERTDNQEAGRRRKKGEINHGMKMRGIVILPEEQQHCLRECLEVVVPVDLRVVPQRYLTKHLCGGKGSIPRTQDMTSALKEESIIKMKGRLSPSHRIKLKYLLLIRGAKNKLEKRQTDRQRKRNETGNSNWKGRDEVTGTGR